MTVGVQADLTTGDPMMTGSPSDMALLINVFDPLTRRDDTGKLVPSLATKWEQTDPTTWKFTLRTDVKFSNGEPFNADSVKFSLERILKNPKSPIQELRSIKEVVAVDDSTVDILTNQPDPTLPGKLALFGGMMVPPKYVQEKGDDYFANNPVGTGPYTLSNWKHGDSFTLKANTAYWGGAPKVGDVTVRYIPDSSTRVAALLNHDVNLINGVPTTAANNVKNGGGIRLEKSDGLRIYYVSIAATDGPLANAKVREALSYATDTKTLIAKMLDSYGVQIGAPLATTNYGADVAPSPYPYDVAKAKQLLSDAGFGDGFDVEFDTQSGIYQDIATAVAQMWSQIGVKADVKLLPDATFEDKYSNGNLSPAWNNGYTMWQGDPTTLIGTFFKSGMPRAKFFSPDFDKVINELSSQTDPAKRKDAMKGALATLHDQAPWIYLFQANDLYGIDSALHWSVPTNQLLTFATLSW